LLEVGFLLVGIAVPSFKSNPVQTIQLLRCKILLNFGALV
jgi:hypothetical protein